MGPMKGGAYKLFLSGEPGATEAVDFILNRILLIKSLSIYSNNVINYYKSN